MLWDMRSSLIDDVKCRHMDMYTLEYIYGMTFAASASKDLFLFQVLLT